MNCGYVLLDLSEYVFNIEDGVFTVNSSTQGKITPSHINDCMLSGKPLHVTLAFQDGGIKYINVLCTSYISGEIYRSFGGVALDNTGDAYFVHIVSTKSAAKINVNRR